MLMAEAGAYNQRHPKLPVYFAVGYALSTEHPGLSREQLFRQADEDMYRNKQLWYGNDGAR